MDEEAEGMIWWLADNMAAEMAGSWEEQNRFALKNIEEARKKASEGLAIKKRVEEGRLGR